MNKLLHTRRYMSDTRASDTAFDLWRLQTKSRLHLFQKLAARIRTDSGCGKNECISRVQSAPTETPTLSVSNASSSLAHVYERESQRGIWKKAPSSSNTAVKKNNSDNNNSEACVVQEGSSIVLFRNCSKTYSNWLADISPRAMLLARQQASTKRHRC